MRVQFYHFLVVVFAIGTDADAISAPSALALSPGLSVILPSTKGLAALHGSCPSRAPEAPIAPCSVSPSPTRIEISELEVRLGELLAERLNAAKRSHPQDAELKVADYYRQYWSLAVGGRRIIYVNGFHRFIVENFRAPDWRNNAVMVFDGGRHFFSVAYDPETKTFSNFAFHGDA
jgi:hypothetical protein